MYLYLLKSLTANRKVLKANPPLTSVIGDHHGVQCHLLFIWMVIYSLHFWTILVRILKTVVEYCFEQWMIWMCGAAPLAIYIHTRPRPEMPPLMI
ncbi:hypothetical protein SFRURICE_004442, partial [Spodoptera frugiperda]